MCFIAVDYFALIWAVGELERSQKDQTHKHKKPSKPTPPSPL